MYSLRSYGLMVADRVRVEAYSAALRGAVSAGSVVLDIGTGTGFFAMLACRYGARKVYAIETSDMIEIGRRLARANGVESRIDFIQGLSTEVSLPEPVDVVICDLRGVLPLMEGNVSSVADARDRLLAPGGTLIPQRDTLWAAVVEAPGTYAGITGPWDTTAYDLDSEPARQLVVNGWDKESVRPEQLLTEPASWGTLDYTSITEPSISSQLSWTVRRGGTAHGFVAWFDTVLAEGIGFSNAPDAPPVLYGNAFFPFSSPVDLLPGDTIEIDLQAKHLPSGYVWVWNTRIFAGAEGAQPKYAFRQSTLYGAAISKERWERAAATHVPELSDEGLVQEFILNRMNGISSIEEIAQEVATHFPGRFGRWEDALDTVSKLSRLYSR